MIVALSTAALYTMLYTPMKTKSPYNTHIGRKWRRSGINGRIFLGSIAGSLPVLIGFSVAGVPLFADFAPWMLFMVIGNIAIVALLGGGLLEEYNSEMNYEIMIIIVYNITRNLFYYS